MKRPDSAKSHQTKYTLDSQNSRKQLEISKFSQTFSSGVKSQSQKADQFKKYVAEKDKDPKFKHLKSKLQSIPQKPTKKQQQKPVFKPFQRKKTTQKAKIQQKQQKVDESLSLSRGFAQKNKQKMNSLKMTASQLKKQQARTNQVMKSKINFDSFKIVKPGQKRQSKKIQAKKIQQNQKKQTNSQNKIQSSKKVMDDKTKKIQEQKNKQKQLKQIQRYINQVQAKNIDSFPAYYDYAIQNIPQSVEDLQKIDLRNFINQPTEGDYQNVKKKIKDFDKRLQTEQVQQSIDLQAILNDSDQQKVKQQEDILSSMASEDLKKRNAFITQILSGKISKKQIDQMTQMNKQNQRFYKIQHQNQHDDHDVQIPQINMVKRKTNRLLQRNRLEAVGQLYRDCDYLSEQNQRRLQQLLSDKPLEDPFQFSQLQRLRQRGIDEGIHMYRELSQSSYRQEDIFAENNLPREPQLRKQAQKKIFRQKMIDINQKLSSTNKINVKKSDIKQLIKKFEHTRPSRQLQQIQIEVKNRFQQQLSKLKQAQDIAASLNNKQNMQQIIKAIQNRYDQLKDEIQQYNQIDQKKLKQMMKQKLKRKKNDCEAIMKQIQQQINTIQNVQQQIQKIKNQTQQIELIQIQKINCQGFKNGQTLEDIDKIITQKWKNSNIL